MTINITLSNASGFPGLDTNSPINPTEQTILPTVYEYGNEFSIEVNFTYVPPIVLENGVNEFIDIEVKLKSFSSDISNSSKLNITQIDTKTLRISGKAIDIFNDAFYQFIMPDNSLQILPVNTSEKFLALVKYSPPFLKRKTVFHNVNYDVKYLRNVEAMQVTNDLTINNTTVFTQDIVWNYDTAITEFNSILARGII